MAEFHRLTTWQTAQDAFSNLHIAGLRTVLAIAGIAVGCAAIVALLSIGNSAAEASIRTFNGLGTDTLVATFNVDGSETALVASADLAARVSGLQDLAVLDAVAPISLAGIELRKRRLRFSAVIVGSTPDLAAVLRLVASEGRFLNAQDKRTTRVVLGHSVAQRLDLGDVASVTGQQLEVDGYLFEIIGKLARQPSNPMIPVAIDESIFIPLESMGRVRDAPKVNVVVARASRLADMDSAAAILDRHLTKINRAGVEVQIPARLLDGMREQARTFSYLLSGVGAISLLVGGVGVMNVMLMSIMERRREIGVRLAIGARPRDIGTMFLAEALILVLAGSIIGAILGVIIALCFTAISGWSFALAPESIPLGVVASFCTGLIFGLYPALAAARLQPVEALRDA